VNALSDTWYMTGRAFRAFLRQPMFVAFTLIQPMIWLLLFGQLFKSITQLPNFGAPNYETYLVPSIVVMSAFFGAGWGGMAILDDLTRGVLDRFLISPVSRSSLIVGRLLVQVLAIVIQAAIILLLGLAVGASYHNVVMGVLVLMVASNLLATAIGALSYGLALMVRREESIIAASNFVLMPLQFTSTGFMALSLIPHWMQEVTRYNPVNWTLVAGRGALESSPDWGPIFENLGYLAILMVACGWLSTRAFRSYQRSM
jgi:ABC-2 type transport system permease protein